MDLTNDIIRGCKQGDRKAQEQLYKNFYASMINICQRYTGNEQDAVEVMNNGFLKVFNNIQRYESGKGTLYTWIRTVVVHCCLDYLKLRQRQSIHEEIYPEAEEIQVEPEAISNMKVNQLLLFVRQLPAATRTVFNLYIMEGYTHKEIASILNISEGTSKWHLSEARKNLKQMISLQEVKL